MNVLYLHCLPQRHKDTKKERRIINGIWVVVMVWFNHNIENPHQSLA